MTGEEATVWRTFQAMSEARGTPVAERTALMERWFDPEIEYVEDGSWPGSSSYRGREAVRDAFAGYEEILGGNLTVEEVLTGSEGLLAVVLFKGESTGASVPWEQRWAYHCRVRNEKISYFRAFAELDEARRAAGVK